MGAMSYKDFYENDLKTPVCKECACEENLLLNKVTGELICVSCAAFTQIRGIYPNEEALSDNERNK